MSKSQPTMTCASIPVYDASLGPLEYVVNVLCIPGNASEGSKTQLSLLFERTKG